MVRLLFYDQMDCSINLNTIEEVTVLRPHYCLSPGVIWLPLNPATFRRYRAFHCVSVLVWFACLCVCVCVVIFSVALRCGNGKGECEMIH